ncbi:hypothetical protein MLD38_005758 [Melastoma candidum]|uniref:Uncharacterized protein n=1 Tax=Melastoma candidum TaxID=119954 RepID=A0ACB9RLV9_9MYRT|nr:hypothetical protein MLD38_005758 [Melastoma candidum]
MSQFLLLMEVSFSLIMIVLVCSDVVLAMAGESEGVFDVRESGAVGDGITDDTEAFLEAWEAACGQECVSSTLVVPDNSSFLVGQIIFKGPCKASQITFQVLGEIVAPASPLYWEGLDPSSWIVFRAVNRLHVTGTGLINGGGTGWWDQSCRYHPELKGCTVLAPTAMKFISCASGSLTKVRFVNSSQTHVLIMGCWLFYVDSLMIKAPGNSPNTDGIHIQSSQYVTISHVAISTGDDCISIGDHTSNIYVFSATCGPGHGISIGSLGRGGNFVQVQNIFVAGVLFRNTTNGARIKTWQVGKGYVRNVLFEHLHFDSVRNPVIIDQNYCFTRGACPEIPHSGVQISNVAYINLFGTSQTEIAINLNCSRTVACTGIMLGSIYLTSASPGKQANSSCTNAYGNTIGRVHPPSCLIS